MYALWIFGPAIERRYGPARYLALYLAAGLWGSAGALILSPNGYTVGASGAIFGLMGAFVAIAQVQGPRDLGGVGALIAINLVFTFADPRHLDRRPPRRARRRRRLRHGLRADRAGDTRGTTTQVARGLVALGAVRHRARRRHRRSSPRRLSRLPAARHGRLRSHP